MVDIVISCQLAFNRFLLFVYIGFCNYFSKLIPPNKSMNRMLAKAATTGYRECYMI
jgi:hypothetical protein